MDEFQITYKRPLDIVLPVDAANKLWTWLNNPNAKAVVFPIMGNWFELSEEQEMANSIARISGMQEPYPDPNLCSLEIAMPNLHSYLEMLRATRFHN